MKNRLGKKSFRCGKSRLLLLLLLLLAIVLKAPATSFAARPLVTDDTGTVGKGKTQIELGTEWFSWKDTVEDVRVKETGTEASGVFTYGLSESVDLVAGFPYVWSRAKENGETVFSDDGLNDISLEAKWRFFEKNGFGLALKPGITFPTGDYEKGFGTGRVFAVNRVSRLGNRDPLQASRNRAVPGQLQQHRGCSLVKNLGKKHNKPIHMLASFSLSTVSHVLSRKAERQTGGGYTAV